MRSRHDGSAPAAEPNTPPIIRLRTGMASVQLATVPGIPLSGEAGRMLALAGRWWWVILIAGGSHPLPIALDKWLPGHMPVCWAVVQRDEW